MIKETSGDRTESYYKKAISMTASRTDQNQALLIGGIVCALHLEDYNETIGDALANLNEKMTTSTEILRKAIEESATGGS